MTPAYPLDGQPATPECPVLLDRLNSELGTGRMKTAGCRQQRRYDHLIAANESDKHESHYEARSEIRLIMSLSSLRITAASVAYAPGSARTTMSKDGTTWAQATLKCSLSTRRTRLRRTTDRPYRGTTKAMRVMPLADSRTRISRFAVRNLRPSAETRRMSAERCNLRVRGNAKDSGSGVF
jgi:hypothetical protein